MLGLSDLFDYLNDAPPLAETLEASSRIEDAEFFEALPGIEALDVYFEQPEGPAVGDACASTDALAELIVVTEEPAVKRSFLRSVSRRLRWDLARALIRARRRHAVLTSTARRIGARAFAAGLWTISLPSRTAREIASWPSRIAAWWDHLPWQEWLAVRRGFLVGVMIGLSVAGSTLWALSSLPYLPGHPIEPVATHAPVLPPVRYDVPSELAWFFIQFPFVTESSQIRAKNRHTYVVSDGKRRREYVVQLGQRFRRVEIYAAEDTKRSQVIVFTPGAKRTVWMEGALVASDSTSSDPNLWMWRAPLWNATHLKIYALADLWLDSPFKRFSCAGFVHRYLADAGVRVPILDAWDLAKQPWTRVSLEEIEPGDIITIKAASASHRRFWHHSVTHVGVYIGHGKLIHASTPSRQASRSFIRIADIDDFRSRIDKVLRPPEML